MIKDIVCEDHDDNQPEHYEALVQLPRWQWLGHDGKIVDLRRRIYTRTFPWAVNILVWMEKHHTDNTPYMCTAQYQYIENRISYLKMKAASIFRGLHKL
jgi:hypothetical protein